MPAGSVRKLPGYTKYVIDYYGFRDNGTYGRIQKAVSENLSVAKAALRAAETEADLVRNGIKPSVSNGQPVEEVRQAYLDSVKLQNRPATFESYRRALSNILSFLNCETVADITPRKVVGYRNQRANEASNRTANLELSALKSMLNWAVANQLCASNPVALVTPLPKKPVRSRRALTEQEIESLLSVSPAPLALVWRTFLCTAMRRSELTTLRWKDVDLERGAIRVRGEIAKTGVARTIPIPDGLRQELAKLKMETQFTSSEFVFLHRRGQPWKDNWLIRNLRRCLKRAEIDSEGVDLHSFRYTVATHMIRNGADPKTVQDFLGHKTIKMTMEIYAQVIQSSKKQALDFLPSVVREGQPSQQAQDEKHRPERKKMTERTSSTSTRAKSEVEVKAAS